MYAVLPSRIEPGFGYIYVYRPDQCPTPNHESPDPTQTGLGVSQAGPVGLHGPVGCAPQGGRAVLLGQGFQTRKAYFVLFKGAGPRDPSLRSLGRVKHYSYFV